MEDVIMKQIKSFKVIIFDFNSKKTEFYDVIPFFTHEFELLKSYKSGNFNKYIHRPRNRAEVKEFVERLGHYMFWARCEWEIIVSGWPVYYDKSKFTQWIKTADLNKQEFTWYDIPDFRVNEQKIDVWDQINANIDLIVDILCEYFKIN